MKFRICLFLLTLILFPSLFYGQLRMIYLDQDSSNAIRNINFKKGSGFVTFDHGLGYSTDSGRTFTSKPITYGSVAFNGYSPDTSRGFHASGVCLLGMDSIFVFGDYASVPSILLSTNLGNTFTLIYHQQVSTPIPGNSCFQMAFVGNSPIGFALEKNGILKTTDRGKTWQPAIIMANRNLVNMNLNLDNSLLALTSTGLISSVDLGASFKEFAIPSGQPGNISFSDANFGWLVVDDKLYQTKNGGGSWTLQNDPQFYPVGKNLILETDSIGYCIGRNFQILKTRSWGKYWEPVIRENPLVFKGYTHNTIFLSPYYIFWAGGGHGMLEIGSLSNLYSRPVGKFTHSTDSLGTTGQVFLINHSNPDNRFNWLVNGQVISTQYNASYISARRGMDTIQLISYNSYGQDTVSVAIPTDTVLPPVCSAAFTAKIDSATVQFREGSADPALKHEWRFGDGQIDQIQNNPTHTYSAIGAYKVWHKVINPTTQCVDSVSMQVNIVSLRTCLSASFSADQDSTLANTVRFQATIDSLSTGPANRTWVWQFGDGGLDSNQLVINHEYAKPGNYTVCLAVTNRVSSCTTTSCQVVTVKAPAPCTGAFTIYADKGPGGYLLPEQVVLLKAPAAGSPGRKSHLWIINNKDSIYTGSADSLRINFFHPAKSADFNWNSSCTYTDLAEINLDSLNKIITHVVVDSATNCSASSTQNYTVPRKLPAQVYIFKDPAMPKSFDFIAYLSNGQDSIPYNTVWQIDGPDGKAVFGIYAKKSDEYAISFAAPGPARVAIADSTCSPVREVYYKYFTVPNTTCTVDVGFKAIPDSTNPLRISFLNTSRASTGNTIAYIWDFGNGANSTQENPVFEYSVPGTYVITLSAINGPCYAQHDTTIVIAAIDTCRLKTSFTDTITGSLVRFAIQTSNSVGASTYAWSFGDGSVSTLANPSHLYTLNGTYAACVRVKDEKGCEATFCDSIQITVLPTVCSLKVSFIVQIDSADKFLVHFSPVANLYSDSLKYLWYFGNGDSSSQKEPFYRYPAAGNYFVSLKATLPDGSCADIYGQNLQIITPSPSCLEPASFQAIVDRNQVSFTVTSSLSPAYQLRWDFGDSSTSTQVQPVHIYDNLGEYKACLQLVTDSGCVSTACDTILISSSNFQQLALYPNPVSSTFTLQYTAADKESLQIQLLTESGLILARYSEQAHKGINRYQYLFSGLSTGYHIIRVISSSGKTSTIRFLKM